MKAQLLRPAAGVRLSPPRLALIFGWLLGLPWACDDTPALCVRDSDCPAGKTCAEGAYAPLIKNDSGKPEAGPDQGPEVGPGEAGPLPDRSWGDGDGGPVCQANHNGKVEREEMVLKVPSKVQVVLGGGVTVNLAGAPVAGKTTWDLSGAAPDDQKQWMAVELVPAWTAASFKGASYASQLMARFGWFTKVDLLGVFRLGQSALQLMGAASDKANHTRLTYASPLDMLRLPVVKGDAYTTSAQVTGFSEYTVPVWLSEQYAITVLDGGSLRLLPNFSLDVLLVKVVQEVHNPANPLLKVRTFAFLFVAECYGVVARVIASADPGKDLSAVKVKERWKLAPP